MAEEQARSNHGLDGEKVRIVEGTYSSIPAMITSTISEIVTEGSPERKQTSPHGKSERKSLIWSRCMRSKNQRRRWVGGKGGGAERVEDIEIRQWSEEPRGEVIL